jgi:Tfp pilus assembly protein PilX
MNLRASRNGSALITCTIVLVVVSALAVSLAGVSGVHLQIADNQQRANRAFASAESGLEVMRYWLSRARIPSSTPPQQYLSCLIALVRDDLQANGISNFSVETTGSIPLVALDATTGQSFQGQWSASPSDPTIIQVAVTGATGTIARTVTVEYSIQPFHFPIFNYGVATRGALQFPRNPTLTGATQNWEADIYVESSNSLLAVDISGNATFDGDIDIGNPNAGVSYAGSLNIAGDTGDTAIANHVQTLVEEDRPEFPVPDVAHFRQYATGPVLDSSFPYNGSGVTLTNAVIAAGTNPTFSGSGAVTIQGILYIETPNTVTFAKNVALQGLIVAEGDPTNLGTNALNFQANFASTGYPEGSQFDAIRQEQGSSILAPGSAVSFTGNFSSVNGVLAAGSLYFNANASAIVKGTMITYSSIPTRVDGNISMNFDRTAMVEIPAGFDLYRVLMYNPASYALAF